MRPNRIVLCFAVITGLLLVTATGGAEFSETWNTTYGTADADESACSIITTPQGGYLFSGDANRSPDGSTDAWIVNLTGTGDEVWNRSFGGPGNDTARSVLRTPDETYLFAGQLTNATDPARPDTDAWIVEIDASGTEVWNATFGGAGVNSSAYAVINTTDGGYLFAGSAESYGSGITDALVVKLNGSGREEWRTTFGEPATNESAYAIVEADNGDFLFAGSTGAYGAGKADAWILRMDSSGSELWNRTLGGPEADEAYSILQNGDGDFILAGIYTYLFDLNRTDSDAWVIRIDDRGDEVWNRTYGGFTVNASAQAIIRTGTGGYFYAGSIEDYGTGDVNAWIVQIDETGESLWEGIFGGGNADSAASILEASPTCYVFAGTFNATGPNGTNTNQDAWVAQICEVTEPTPPPAQPAAVGDSVWNDENGNGIQETNEPGIPDVKVRLIGGSGAGVATTRTDTDGKYTFSGLSAGIYALKFDAPRPYVITLQNAGSDPARDSDANPVTGKTNSFQLGPGQRDMNRDCGMVDVRTIRLTLEKATNGEDADRPPGPAIPPGDPVNWTYAVNNTGRVPLDTLQVWDDRQGSINTTTPSGDANGNDLLDPGENWTFVKNDTATAGQYENIALATGRFTVVVAGDIDRSHYTSATPGTITITKYTNGEDAKEPPGPEIPIGDPVNWTYNVTNTGSDNLTNITVTDDRIGQISGPPTGDALNPGILDPGETWVFATNGTAVNTSQAPWSGYYENNGTVTANASDNREISAVDQSHYTNPRQGIAAIALNKLVNGQDPTGPAGPEILIGDPVNWTYEVRNTGTSNLTNITVTDDRIGQISGPPTGDAANPGTLDPGEIWIYEAQDTALNTTEAPWNGYYRNNGTVTADDQDAGPVTASDTCYYTNPTSLPPITAPPTPEPNITPPTLIPITTLPTLEPDITPPMPIFPSGAIGQYRILHLYPGGITIATTMSPGLPPIERA